MFNLGFSEIMIIGVLALLLIGPKQLPEVAKVLGRMMAEFKKATVDLQGGLLDVKKELQKPIQDSFEAIAKIEENVRNEAKSIYDENSQVLEDDTTIRIHKEDLATTQVAHNDQPHKQTGDKKDE